MTDRLSSPEVFREILAAEAKLAAMDIAADFVALWESETCPALQRHFADQYRKMTGVDPSQRQTFAEALERIRQSGEGTVREIIAALSQTGPRPGAGKPGEPAPPGSAR